MATLRHINDAGLAIIQKREGLRLKPYPDARGFSTVGWGHKILPSDIFTYPLTQEQADNLLRADCAEAEMAVAKYVSGELTDNEFSACVSLCYNIGSGDFEHSQVAEQLNKDNTAEAAKDFMNWNHVNGVVNPWLTQSRQAEQDLFNDTQAPAGDDTEMS